MIKLFFRVGFYLRFYAVWVVAVAFLVTSADAANELRCMELFQIQAPVTTPLTLGEVTLLLKKLGLTAEDGATQETGNLKFGGFRFLNSKIARLLRQFSEKWDIEIIYTNTVKEQPIHTVIENSEKVTALFFPIRKLQNFIALAKIITELDLALTHVKRLKQLGAELSLFFRNEGLQIGIYSVSKATPDSFLKWIGNRIDRHDIKFEFKTADHSTLLTDAAGFASGKNIVIRQEYLDLNSEKWLTEEGIGVLAHEITHATFFAKWLEGDSNGEKLIYFLALGDSALPYVPNNYKKGFRSDEIEGNLTQLPWSPNPSLALYRARQFAAQKKWLMDALSQIKKDGMAIVQFHKLKYRIRVQDENTELEVQIPYKDPVRNHLDPKTYIENLLTKRINQIETLEKFQLAL